MATQKKASKSEDVASEPQPKSKKKTLIIALTVLLLIGATGGGTAWYFLSKSAATVDGEAAAEPVPPKPPVFTALDPFVVNLQPEMGEQYLQVAMTLQVSELPQAEQIKLYMPVVRSRLLVLLSSKNASELNSPEGKTKLAEEIIAVLNEPFSPGAPSLGVDSVFFTAFVIQ